MKRNHSADSRFTGLLRSMSGLSMIELMIALTISSLLLLGISNLFIGSKRTYLNHETLSRLQEDARIAMSRLKYDIRMAGSPGDTYQTWDIRETETAARKLPAVTNECFTTPAQRFRWAAPLMRTQIGGLQISPPRIFGSDNGIGLFDGCLDDADFQVGTDVLSVHYATATPIPDDELVGPGTYLRSRPQEGVVYFCPEGVSGDACLPPVVPGPIGANNYDLVSRVYYVRNWSVIAGDGIPALVQVSLSPDGGGMIAEPQVLISGVENMQLEYGLDTDGDGVIDRYMRADQLPSMANMPGFGAWNSVKTVRVWLLMRSMHRDPARSGLPATSNQFVLSNAMITLPPEFYARVYSSTIATRNPGSRGGGI